CSPEVFSYHGCKNRSCSKCHTDDTDRWLQARKLQMLPCHYFHVTVTAPEELRRVLRANQRDGYGLLMKAAAEAIIDIAGDPRFVGGHGRCPCRLAYLDTAAQLSPPRALPRYRWRRLSRRHLLASRTPLLLRP